MRPWTRDLSITAITVIIMFASIIKAFGMSSTPEILMGAERNINLSGNVFAFRMPENFSRDMPAEPLIENLSIDPVLTNISAPLIQRWWDIKEPGFFGKALGTVMMNITVHPTPENTRKITHKHSYTIQDRADLILTIDESINARYEQAKPGEDASGYSLPGIAYLIGYNLETEYRDHTFNNQKWTGYTIAGPGAQLLVAYVLPVDEHHFIEALFIFSPNDNVAPRHFQEYAYDVTTPIQESFHLQYTAANPLRVIVEGPWLHTTTGEALREHPDDLVKSLFGEKNYQDYSNHRNQEALEKNP